MYSGLLAVHAGGRNIDLSSVRLCVSAGEHLSAALFTEWRKRFGIEIIDGIGCTECLHIFIAGDRGDLAPGVTGTVIEPYEAKLLDEDGHPVSPGDVGHLFIRGPTTAARYWNNQEATHRTMVGEWIRTGDVFWQDDRQRFVFQGRSDDLIKVGGLKVSPVEVEAVLLSHPRVRECAVVAARGEYDLAEVVAYVCTDPDLDGDEGLARELRRHVTSRLNRAKTPKRIEFVDELPRTSTGKIARYKLRQTS
jgi:acyl-coenzyme A synthetase/AMP-(fatty) acid ligase